MGGGAPPAGGDRRARGEAPASRRRSATRTPTSCPTPERAEACYRAALELEPGRRSTLHKLLDIYTKDAALAARDRSAEPAGEDRGRSGGPGAHAVHGGADPARRAEPARRGGVAAGALPGRGARHDRRLRGSRGAAQGRRATGRRSRTATGAWSSACRPTRRTALRLSLWTRLGDIAVKQLHDRKLALQRVRGGGRAGTGRRRPPGDAGPPLRAVRARDARAGDRRRTRSCSRAIRTAPIRTARWPSCTATATKSTSSGASPRRCIT